MPLFGPPNVEKLKAKGNVKGLIKALGYEKDIGIRSHAARALGQIGDPAAVDPLIVLLRAGDDALQGAAWALGQIGDVRAVEPLIVVLNNGKHARHQTYAAESLGQIGDARAVDALIDALRDRNNDLQKAAAEALGQIGDARAVFPLVAVLRGRDQKLRIAAAMSLGQIGDARAVDPLVGALRDSNDDVRKAATNALVEIGNSAIKPLVDKLSNPDIRIRRQSVEILDRLVWIPDRGDSGTYYWIAKGNADECAAGGEGAVKPLITCLSNKDRPTRKTASQALAMIGDAAVEPLIEALGDDDRQVRLEAEFTLGKIGDGRAIEPLILLLPDSDLELFSAGIRALASIYESGNLTDDQKLILLQESDSLERRNSYHTHNDEQTCFDHKDGKRHSDTHYDFNSLI